MINLLLTSMNNSKCELYLYQTPQAKLLSGQRRPFSTSWSPKHCSTTKNKGFTKLNHLTSLMRQILFSSQIKLRRLLHYTYSRYIFLGDIYIIFYYLLLAVNASRRSFSIFAVCMQCKIKLMKLQQNHTINNENVNE